MWYFEGNFKEISNILHGNYHVHTFLLTYKINGHVYTAVSAVKHVVYDKCISAKQGLPYSRLAGPNSRGHILLTVSFEPPHYISLMTIS